MYIRIILLLSSVLLFVCRPQAISNFGVEDWYAYDLNYKQVKFAALPQKKRLILNFYSPTCVPCIKELPALELLYRKAHSKDLIMFLALVPQLDLDSKESSADKLDFREKHSKLAQIIRKDIYRYGISIPFVIMSENFRVGPQELVQATPETLFFVRRPCVWNITLSGLSAMPKQSRNSCKTHASSLL